MNIHRNAPIGVLDSGVGGISVLREIRRRMPGESVIFYGDSANAPYGIKTRENVRSLVFRATTILWEQGVKALVIACNTATGAAILDLRKAFPDRIIVGIEPAIKPAALAFPGGKIIVMATPGTLSGDKFSTLMHEHEQEARIIPLPCGGLMEYVENGILEGKELTNFLHEHLDPLLPADAIVLGCTHYPFLKRAIAEVAPGTQLFDGGEGTARELQRRLLEADLCSEAAQGEVVFQNSLPTEEMFERCHRLLETSGF